MHPVPDSVRRLCFQVVVDHYLTQYMEEDGWGLVLFLFSLVLTKEVNQVSYRFVLNI